jgi:hypothetical protein
MIESGYLKVGAALAAIRASKVFQVASKLAPTGERSISRGMRQFGGKQRTQIFTFGGLGEVALANE